MPLLRPAAWLLPLLLAGCQGTALGDRLAASFSGAPTGPAAATPAAGTPATPPAAGNAAPGGAGPAAAASAAAPRGPGQAPATRPWASNPAQRPAASAPAATARPPASPAVPPAGTAAARPSGASAPYRIILRLPLADPAAPAEVVTQALRAAGVPFEVETIERMGAAGAPSTPPAVEAPVARPAPAPR